eukprot:CAMPEP_0184854986 /NCGR_PEP_ID=MMETSP0580-20130426/341_1 /TAXON_ID=1118495 /ORGANISM="Dactyliosolen fragilissimus" /LENGTH=149 /DNA_ID=CAMNT_0027349387 /DNA_START=402 /DNA_END=848 /DNA_ORIENTATION=+
MIEPIIKDIACDSTFTAVSNDKDDSFEQKLDFLKDQQQEIYSQDILANIVQQEPPLLYEGNEAFGNMFESSQQHAIHYGKQSIGNISHQVATKTYLQSHKFAPEHGKQPFSTTSSCYEDSFLHTHSDPGNQFLTSPSNCEHDSNVCFDD